MRRPTRARTGIALRWVMATLAPVFSLSSAFLDASTAGVRVAQWAVETTQLFCEAEAGLQYALHDDETWALPCEKDLPTDQIG